MISKKDIIESNKINEDEKQILIPYIEDNEFEDYEEFRDYIYEDLDEYIQTDVCIRHGGDIIDLRDLLDDTIKAIEILDKLAN